MHLSDTFSKFHGYLTEMEFQPKTIEAYLYEIERLSRILPPDIEISFITSHMIDDFFKVLETEKDYSPHTIARTYTALNTFFKYLHYEQYIHKNPMIWVKKIEFEITSPSYLSDDEINRLIDVDLTSISQTPERDLAILDLLINTGLKVQEIIELKVINVDFSKEVLNIPAIGKGRARIVPIPKSTITRLNHYNNTKKEGATHWLFLSISNNKLSPDRIQRMVKRVGEAANIPHVTPNILRRSFEKRLVREGKSIDTIQYLMGFNVIKSKKISQLLEDI